jgi:hypothetical protein
LEQVAERHEVAETARSILVGFTVIMLLCIHTRDSSVPVWLDWHCNFALVVRKHVKVNPPPWVGEPFG